MHSYMYSDSLSYSKHENLMIACQTTAIVINALFSIDQFLFTAELSQCIKSATHWHTPSSELFGITSELLDTSKSL